MTSTLTITRMWWHHKTQKANISLAAESVALWAFQGSASPPPWVCLQAGQGDHVLGLQERFLPLALQAYGCPPSAAQQTRRDLELLKQATGPQ